MNVRIPLFDLPSVLRNCQTPIRRHAHVTCLALTVAFQALEELWDTEKEILKEKAAKSPMARLKLGLHEGKIIEVLGKESAKLESEAGVLIKRASSEMIHTLSRRNQQKQNAIILAMQQKGG
jgi:hypothetical protein